METVTPEQVGLSSQRLARLAPLMQSYVDQGKLAGLITLVARRGQVAHLQCFGQADIAAGKPMQPDTILRIYSMTKPVTSVALLMLYEEGRFQLDDPVAEFIPAFKEMWVCLDEAAGGGSIVTPAERPVTIRQLLTHTSGLCYPNPKGSPAERLLWRSDQEAENTTPEETLAEWVPRLAGVPLAWQPGSRWQYGFSTDVLGYLVEVISGLPFDRFLQERIFSPLGMVDTGFTVPPEKLDRLATLYGPAQEGGLKVLDGAPASEYARPRRFFSGGSGLVATTGDYLRFAQMLLNRGELDGVRLLGRKTVELMTMNHLPAALLPYGFGDNALQHGRGFGLGVFVVMDVAQHGLLGSVGNYGWSGAAQTHFWVDPQEELIAMVMPQYMPEDRDYPLREQFRVLVYQALD